MKKKMLLATAVGLVLLGAVIAAALNAIFTVTDVVVQFYPVSEEGVSESYSLQQSLNERYVGKSTTFLHLDEVKKAVDEFPRFALEEIKKEFPRTVALTVRERRETFAFERGDGSFGVLDEEGVYLYDKPSLKNHRGAENILLSGFDLKTDDSGNIAQGEYLSEALAFTNVLLKGISNVRINLVSITLMGTENALAGSHFFRLRMREGLFIDVYGPKNATEEKAEGALQAYLSLGELERMYGFFDIVDSLDGGFTVSEHRADTPTGI